MTSINESEPGIAGLSVVLRSTTEEPSTPLKDWLRKLEHTPVWIPRRQRQGVTRVLAVLSQPEHYPTLMELLWEQISQNTTVEWQEKSYNLTGVEVDNHDLHVLRIPIFSAQPLPTNLGRAIHALCFGWLAAADSALAERLHQHNHLPITLAIQPSLRQLKSCTILNKSKNLTPQLLTKAPASLPPPTPSYKEGGKRKNFFSWKGEPEILLPSPVRGGVGGGVKPIIATGARSQRQPTYLRIGLLQKELLAPILWGISQDLGGEITLTDMSCRLGKWVEIQQTSSFEALSQVPPSNVIELQFLSPTSFKQGQRIQPFPLPELVFGSLLRRWNAFAPSELQFPIVEWQGLTCAYELKTQVLHLKGGTEIGTAGWVRYEFPDSFQAKIATTLAHFARFAGVGRKTGMGMGQVRIR